MASPKDRELSLTLIGLAASLLVGTFAAYNGYLGVADAEGDKVLTGLLVCCTAILTLSIACGGWGISRVEQGSAQGYYNAQAILGVIGLLFVLVMPVSVLGALPEDADVQSNVVLEKAVAALAEENTRLRADLNALTVRLDALE